MNDRPVCLIIFFNPYVSIESLGTGSDLESSFLGNRTGSRNCGTAQAYVLTTKVHLYFKVQNYV